MFEPYNAARGELGVSEKTSPETISGYIKDAKCGNFSPSDPWCALFVNAMLERNGIQGSRSAMARSFLNWGVPVDAPVEGCVAVFSRGSDPQSGHVGFFVKETSKSVYVLGGNQGDRVSIQAYPKTRLLGYRAAEDQDGSLPVASENVYTSLRILRHPEARAAAQAVLDGKDEYQEVSRRTHIPWYVIGALHSLEADCDFHCTIRDGSPLGGRDWADDAVAVLKAQRFGAGVRIWTWEAIAEACERWNGLGYRKRGVSSPYLWAGTNRYSKGKFVQDGVYDPNAVSRQIGVIPLLKALSELDPSFRLVSEYDAKGPVDVLRKSKSLPALLNAFLIGIFGFFTDALQKAWEFVLWAIGVLPVSLDNAEQARGTVSRLTSVLSVDWPKVAMAVVLATLVVTFVREYQRKRFEE